MPVHSGTAGATTPTLTHDVDARWLMAYAASLGDFNPLYMDTQANAVIAHPVFPVCIEWPVLLQKPDTKGVPLPDLAESARGVHGSHDLHLHRPIRAGDKLATRSTLIGVQATRAGAVSTTRLDTADATTGEAVVTTFQTAVYRGVDVEGEDRSIETAPPLPKLEPLDDAKRCDIHVPEGAAHTYTECARIWNPIHTDRAIALAAGLPDIILHGTATLALAVSRIVDEYAVGQPALVKRLGCRFTSMVLMPSTLSLESRITGDVISFQVKTEAGDLAISDGFVCLGDGA